MYIMFSSTKPSEGNSAIYLIIIAKESRKLFETYIYNFHFGHFNGWRGAKVGMQDWNGEALEETNLSEYVIGAERALFDFAVSGNGGPVSEFHFGEWFSLADVIGDGIVIGSWMIRVAIFIVVAGLAVQGFVGAGISDSVVGVEEGASGGGAGSVPQRGASEIWFVGVSGGGGGGGGGGSAFRGVGDRHRCCHTARTWQGQNELFLFIMWKVCFIKREEKRKGNQNQLRERFETRSLERKSEISPRDEK